MKKIYIYFYAAFLSMLILSCSSSENIEPQQDKEKVMEDPIVEINATSIRIKSVIYNNMRTPSQEFVYDSHGRLVEEISPWNIGHLVRTYQYDNEGRITKINVIEGLQEATVYYQYLSPSQIVITKQYKYDYSDVRDRLKTVCKIELNAQNQVIRNDITFNDSLSFYMLFWYDNFY